GLTCESIRRQIVAILWLSAADAFHHQTCPGRSRALLYFRPWRCGHLSPEHIRSAASPALQFARADPARVRARTRIPDSDRARAQEPAGISAIRLHLRVRRRLGALLRKAGPGNGDVRDTIRAL